MLTWELIPPGRRRAGLLVAALLILLAPALHPLLRPVVGVPSHLLWFAHILPVALIAYEFGLPGAVLTILTSVTWVAGGERLFGAGYGIAADQATMLTLSTAVGSSNALVAGFALAVRAEQAQRRDLAQMVTAALSASPEAVLLLDAHQEIQYANDAAGRLFETPPGQLAGLPFRHLLAENGEIPLAAPEKAGGQQALQVVARTINRRPFAAELSVSPVHDGRPTPIAYLVTVRDQSERVRREQANRRTQTLTELGATIASIAHELNSPLASVVAYAELLQGSQGASAEATADLETNRAGGSARGGHFAPAARPHAAG